MSNNLEQKNAYNCGDEQLGEKESAWSEISVWQTAGLLFTPFVGPIILYIYGVKSDLGELFVVLFNPVVYLLLGIVVSTFSSWKLNRLEKISEKLTKLTRRLHDTKISSLFFLALFEATISIYIVGDGVPIIVLLVALVFYSVYAVLGMLWLKYLAGINKIVKAS